MWKHKEPIKPKKYTKNLSYLCLHQNCTAISGRNFNKLRTVHSQAFIFHLMATEKFWSLQFKNAIFCVLSLLLFNVLNTKNALEQFVTFDTPCIISWHLCAVSYIVLFNLSVVFLPEIVMFFFYKQLTNALYFYYFTKVFFM